MQSWLDGILGRNSNNRKHGILPLGGQGGSTSGLPALQQGLQTLDNNLAAACAVSQPDLSFGVQAGCVLQGWQSQI